MFSAALLAGCGQEAKQQLATVSHVDSLRVDSLASSRKDLMAEVMASTQFMTEINAELAKARSLNGKKEASLETSSEMTAVNEQRKAIVGRISHLVAKLDSVQTRLASARASMKKLTKDDSVLVAQVAQYEKSIADMQAATAQERAQLQGTISQQNTQIATLNSRVDTLTTVRTALLDTVSQLTTEKNTAYYVIGTKDELIKKGVLVQEGGKRFVLVGGRNVVPNRTLDPAAFSKIDRLTDRTIPLPQGEYKIMSRQNASFAKPQVEKDGKIAGALTIDQPEQFWENSRFLIIVRS
jgi:uncharacterized phage infection (PIP) family protein YhgE